MNERSKLIVGLAMLAVAVVVIGVVIGLVAARMVSQPTTTTTAVNAPPPVVANPAPPVVANPAPPVVANPAPPVVVAPGQPATVDPVAPPAPSVIKPIPGPFAWNGSKELHRAAIDADHDQKHTYAGIPRSSGSPLTLLENTPYTAGYSNERRNPLWVAYFLPKNTDPQPYHRKDYMRIDHRTTAKIKHDHYTKTGWQRGHMCPNRAIVTRWGKDAAYETFIMSNIVPQSKSLNGGLWRVLEMKADEHYSEWFDGVWVITGPVFDQNIERLPTEGAVEIPDACYKIFVEEDVEHGQVRMVAYLIDQYASGKQLSPFLVAVDQVEAQTGLDFFHELDDELENALESSPADDGWQPDAIPPDWWVPSWLRNRK